MKFIYNETQFSHQTLLDHYLPKGKIVRKYIVWRRGYRGKNMKWNHFYENQCLCILSIFGDFKKYCVCGF